MTTTTVGTGMDAPIASRSETGADNVAHTTTVVAQQDASPGKGKAAEGLASGIEKVKGFTLPETGAGADASEEVLSADLDFPDIAEASFGTAARAMSRDVLETVHGPDDRVQITSTSVYPWRAHASLLITARDGSMWIGTGWFIGPHTLMTAGHVVYIKNSGVAGRDGFVRSIKVMPGRNGTSPTAPSRAATCAPCRGGRRTAMRNTTTARSSSTPTSAREPAGSVSAFTTTPR